jgi:hypothetical protein
MKGMIVLALLALTAAPGAQSPTPPKSAAGRAGAPAAQADANGFKVGEEVLISTGQGWMKGTIVSANGNVYRVRSQIGIDTTKIYPDEVRRTGPLTARDRAAGQYNLHDAVLFADLPHDRGQRGAVDILPEELLGRRQWKRFGFGSNGNILEPGTAEQVLKR